MTDFITISGKDESEIRELSDFAKKIVKQHFDPIIGSAQNDYMIGKFQTPCAIEQQIRQEYTIPLTLLFAGDSITDADHLWEPETNWLGTGYVYLISERLPDVKLFNRGHDGFTASMMRRFWASDCIALQPDIVTILVGINDLSEHLCWGSGHGAEEYEEHLEWLIRETTDKTDAKIILMEPFIFPRPAEYVNWIEPLTAFREKVRSLAMKYRTGFVPLWDIFQEAQRQWRVDDLTVDGIHLTETGHKILAEAWIDMWHEMEKSRIWK